MLNNISTQDGYTEPFYIAAVPGLWDSLRGKYRPMLKEERDVIRGEFSVKSALQFSRLTDNQLAQRVKYWDNKDEDGNVRTINLESMRTLRPGLNDRLYAIVVGGAPSDPDPENPAASQADADLETQAILEGRTTADVREDNDAKN